LQKILCFALLACLFADRSYSARPLETDDAGTVDPQSVEFELGAVFESDPAADAWVIPIGIKTGIMSGLDVGAGFGWQRFSESGRTESGSTDLEAGAKWNFLSETNGLPALSLTAAVKLPTADEKEGLGSGETDWDMNFVLSHTLAEWLIGHLNAGYTWIGSPPGEDVGDVVHGSAALELQFCPACWLTGEILAEREREDGADTMLSGNAGVRWVPVEDLAMDAALGTALHGGDAPDLFATVGLTWLLNLN
jgi:hypothetical protein